MTMSSNENFQIYLKATSFIDCDSPKVIKFAKNTIKNEISDIDKAVKMYYAVRDLIYYDPYRIKLEPDALKASAVLERQYGFCIPKAVLLAALARVEGIPSRLGFANVKNHLSTQRLRKMVGGDIFFWHGYTELFLEDKWVKATPAFNLSLCERFDVKPLEFDGRHDSIFHEYDRKGNRHMEYIADHGQFADLPYNQIVEAFKEHHPLIYYGNYYTSDQYFDEDAMLERNLNQNN